MKTIQIIDKGQERYTIEADTYILGRRYDNNAEKIQIIKPEIEKDSICVMIVTRNNEVVDHIIIENEYIDIKSNITQYESVNIGFSFSKADGYVKNSEIKRFTTLPAQKPDDFIPVEPEQKQSLDLLSKYGFVSAELNNNMLIFKNALGNVASEVQLSCFIQEQVDWNETNDKSETYIKNKPTKLSQFTNDMNFVDKDYVDQNVGGSYTQGTGINISEDNVISIDDTVALKSDIPDTSGFATEESLSGRVIPKTSTTNFVEDNTAGKTSLIFNNQPGNVNKTTIYSGGLEIRNSDVQYAVKLSSGGLGHAGGTFILSSYGSSRGFGKLHSNYGAGLGYFAGGDWNGDYISNIFNDYKSLKYRMDDVSIHLTGDEILEQLSIKSGINFSRYRFETGQTVICALDSTDDNITYKAGHIYLINGTRNAYTTTDITPTSTITYEEQTIQSTSWTALSDNNPYTYQATITITTTLSENSVVELINNQAVLFATYGFAIANIIGQVATIYSIGQPNENINLKLGVTQ